MWYSLSDFYRSKEWTDIRKIVVSERLENGVTVCQHCGKPIYKPYDLILHHKEPLTLQNVNDLSISLNKDNLMIVHQTCHNEIHNRWGKYTRHIYLVYGPPLSGKSTWVNSISTKDDLIVDLALIRKAITGGEPWETSYRNNDVLFLIRNNLLESVRLRRGKWVNAFIVGTYPYTGERERLCKELGAELVFIEATMDECLARLEALDDSRDKKQWEKYIRDWFQVNTPPRGPGLTTS